MADNVVINQLLSERIGSGWQLQMMLVEMDRDEITLGEARRRQPDRSLRSGSDVPGGLGAACAFLCGVQAGYISGVKLHLDGGSYVGLV